MDKETIVKLQNKNRKLEIELSLIKEKALRYELLFELSDDAILVIENDKFIDCNQAVVKMLGYENKSQFLNTHPSELSPERQPDGRLSYDKAQEMNALALKNGSHHFEWIHTKANGDNFPVEVWLSSVKYMDKLLINTIWRNLTEIKKAEDQIKASLKEKDILLKEVHHRVKNNLQIIISLLNIYSQNVPEDSIQIYRKCQDKIHSMALVHSSIYLSDDFENVDLSEYTSSFCNYFFEMVGISNLNLIQRFKPVATSMDRAINFGLILSELLTNAHKYSILTVQNPEITMNLTEENNLVVFQFSDNGPGISEDVLNNDNSNTFGLVMIKDLVTQMDGTCSITFNKGTNYQISFPKQNSNST